MSPTPCGSSYNGDTPSELLGIQEALGRDDTEAFAVAPLTASRARRPRGRPPVDFPTSRKRLGLHATYLSHSDSKDVFYVGRTVRSPFFVYLDFGYQLHPRHAEIWGAFDRSLLNYFPFPEPHVGSGLPSSLSRTHSL